MAFKIYRSGRFIKLYPLIIITFGIENDTTFYWEYFILIRENDTEHYYPLRIWKHGVTKELMKIGINEKFMINQALNASSGELDNFMFDKFIEKYPNDVFSFEIKLRLCKNSELISSYLNGEFSKSFDKFINELLQLI